MIAKAGGRDILIAYPTVGPNLARLARLIGEYPESTIRVVVNNADVARGLAKIAAGLRGRCPRSSISTSAWAVPESRPAKRRFNSAF